MVWSPELTTRWNEPVGGPALEVPNGSDTVAWLDSHAVDPPGARPHIDYAGTLHAERLDVDLVAALVAHPGVGTVRRVGPDLLDEESRRQLDGAAVVRDPPVPA